MFKSPITHRQLFNNDVLVTGKIVVVVAHDVTENIWMVISKDDDQDFLNKADALDHADKLVGYERTPPAVPVRHRL